MAGEFISRASDSCCNHLCPGFHIIVSELVSSPPALCIWLVFSLCNSCMATRAGCMGSTGCVYAGFGLNGCLGKSLRGPAWGSWRRARSVRHHGVDVFSDDEGCEGLSW